MGGTTEAFARVKIDALLKDAGWNLYATFLWHTKASPRPRVPGSVRASATASPPPRG